MTMLASDTIQKSVRLPAEIVEYVELQEGKTFTDKLVNVLNDSVNGETIRRQKIELYDAKIQERCVKLGELNRKVNEASHLVNRLSAFCVAAETAGLHGVTE